MLKKKTLTALLSFAILTSTTILASNVNQTFLKHLKTFDAKASSYDMKNLSGQYTSWAISPYNKKSSINLYNAWKKFKKKKDIVVAVIDTGIDSNHKFLNKNIHVLQGKLSSNNYGVDFSKFSKNKNTPEDSHGHGTHVAGVIKSVFPDVRIVSLKYYSTNPKATGQDNLNSTIDALRYAVDNNVDIINYSGGGPEPSMEELKILKNAEKKGILVVAAAGNEESNIDNKKNAYYPASYRLSNIITVTAHDQDINILPSSNFGKKTVDISAPGYRIKSSFPSNRSSYLTGTSQATAFVTGVAALIKSQFPNISYNDLREIIIESASKHKKLAARCISGGILDADNAIKLASKRMAKVGIKRGVAEKSRTPNSIDFNRKRIIPGRIFYRKAK